MQAIQQLLPLHRAIINRRFYHRRDSFNVGGADLFYVELKRYHV